MNNFNTIIISSRIRLARNVSGIVFPCKMESKNDSDYVVDLVFSILNDFENYRVSELDGRILNSLKEKHLISEELAKNTEFGALSLSHDEQISIMINEEEHIREQCILSGLSLFEGLEKLNEVDDNLLENINIAYDKKYGFLTTCPSNLGTGMRASVMMFLPALSLTNQIELLIEDLKNDGLTVRGNYGEKSDADGFMFQISNSQTLGISENDILEKVESAVLDICEKENVAREKILHSKNVDVIKDKIFRAYGILKYAHILSCEEAYNLISQLRFGISLGFFNNISFELLTQLLEDIQPNTLQMINGNDISLEELDIFRAEYISNKI